MENKKINVMVISLLVTGIISLVVGVTYAFFNYTRTGDANTINVGRVYFISRRIMKWLYLIT